MPWRYTIEARLVARFFVVLTLLKFLTFQQVSHPLKKMRK